MVRLTKKDPPQPRPNQDHNRPRWDLPGLPSPPDEPLENLQPLGGDFFGTPDPASPFDCERWPDSPYCGNNPFSRDPLDLGLSLVLDRCNIGIQIAPTLGFIKLPISQLVYRFSGECQIQKKPEPTPDPYYGCGDNPAERIGLLAVVFSEFGYFYESGLGMGKGYHEVTQSISISEISYPIESNVIIERVFADPFAGTSGYTIYANCAITYNINYSYLMSVAYANHVWGYETIADFVERRGGTVPPFDNDDGEFILNLNGSVTVYYAQGYAPKIKDASNSDIDKTLHGIARDTIVKFLYGDECIERKRSVYKDKTYIKIEESIYKAIPLKNYNPAPPPPDNRKFRMCCDDRVLKALLAKINKIYRIIGCDDYPVNAPQWITKNNSPQITINNLTRFISYTIKQLDSISGNYPIKIKIKDSDLTQTGNQEQTITIPNAAEALAEILGILLTVRTETNATLVASINGMIEAGAAKQSAIIAQQYSQANAEFLGYKGKQTNTSVPYTFTPNEPQIEKMLQPQNVAVKGWENDDKDDFFDAIAPLLELAAMWKAQNFRNTGANSPVEKLTELLKGANNIGSLMNEFSKNPPQPKNEDGTSPPPLNRANSWDEFVNNAETGFINKPGITDTTNPYSRPFDQRPRIKEIGDDTSDTED